LAIFAPNFLSFLEIIGFKILDSTEDRVDAELSLLFARVTAKVERRLEFLEGVL
jgi:hypothetical protein